MSKRNIIQAIKEFDRIIIHRHVRPDPDAYGSQAGLKEMIKSSFPEKEVFIVGEEDPALHFLVRMDDVSDSLYTDALVIVCDTANTERISDERYTLGKKVIKIDHHPNNDPYGDILWIDTNASSTSEMIYELYLEAKDDGFQMNNHAARLIYAGIVGDTGRFLFPSTSTKTFQYAAELVTYNFDRPSLYQGMYSIKDNIARLRGHVLKHFELSPNGVSSVKLSQSTLQAYNISPLETGQLVSILGDIEGIKAWAFFIEEEDDLIRVRLRSKGPIINEIAARYGGGGHPLAAGASVKSWDEADLLVEELEAACLKEK
ncbi:MAG TPA: bifunctional oligoribonuclease/PAP phosphatase NrnA [Virgibacillus sp.]|nr:bifunctional oligoribonuclease/PAP phosphatase NrnA [Virgibacillus sp.]